MLPSDLNTNMSAVLMWTPNPPERGVGGGGSSCSLMVLKLELGDLQNDILGQFELVRAKHSLRRISWVVKPETRAICA